MKKTKKFKKVTEKEISDALLQERIKNYNNQTLADFSNVIAENNILISGEVTILRENFRKLTILQGSVGISLMDLNDILTEYLTPKNTK